MAQEMGTQLKEARLERGLTLQRVSEDTGLSVSFLSDMERGRSVPSVRTLVQLVDYYGIAAVTFLRVAQPSDRRGRIFAAIERKRDYQDSKHGELDEHGHTVAEWSMLVADRAGRAMQRWVEEGEDAALKELLDAAALAIACMEQHGFVETAGGRRQS